jgi:hypothetical protein
MKKILGLILCILHPIAVLLIWITVCLVQQGPQHRPKDRMGDRVHSPVRVRPHRK